MTLTVIGMNYKTAHVSLRESFNSRILDPQRVATIIHEAQSDDDSGCVVLQTCNRFEIYIDTSATPAVLAQISTLMCAEYGLNTVLFAMHTYTLHDHDAVVHSMRVACGIDSLVVGEVQILGQMQHAIQIAREAGVAGPRLDMLFVSAIRVGRVARQRTGIHRVATSVAHAAVQFLQKSCAHTTPRVLVCGAGEMGRVATAVLRRVGFPTTLTNRTLARAQQLQNGATDALVPWDARIATLADVDAVIVATAAQQPVFTAAACAMLHDRTNRPLWFIDLAVPRNVDPTIARIPGVSVANVDDLHVVIEAQHEKLAAAVANIHPLIATHAERYHSWLERIGIVDVICATRTSVEATVQQELARSLRRVSRGNISAEEALREFAHRVAQKVNHRPTMVLKSSIRTPHAADQQQLVRTVFGVDATRDVMEDKG